jgi:hypothetical protein
MSTGREPRAPADVVRGRCGEGHFVEESRKGGDQETKSERRKSGRAIIREQLAQKIRQRSDYRLLT